MTNAIERPAAVSAGPAPGSAAARFAAVRDAAHALLPPWLGRLVPATAIGFAVLSSFTYAVDLLVLALLFDGLGLPYPVAVTGGYHSTRLSRLADLVESTAVVLVLPLGMIAAGGIEALRRLTSG